MELDYKPNILKSYSLRGGMSDQRLKKYINNELLMYMIIRYGFLQAIYLVGMNFLHSFLYLASDPGVDLPLLFDEV
jgi:hypothetical protein